MATEKPRFSITMDEEMFRRVEDFKFQNRYKNQTQAVLALIEMGIKSFSKTPDIDKDLGAEEFNTVESMLESRGYNIWLEEDQYYLRKDKKSVKISVEQLKTLIRNSYAVVEALAKGMLDE